MSKKWFVQLVAVALVGVSVLSYVAFARTDDTVAATQAQVVSASRSLVSPANETINLDDGGAFVKVTLFDENNFPVSGHKVRLFAGSDKVSVNYASYGEVTDSKGEISFFVGANEAGPVTLTAYDASADVTLAAKSNIVFFDEATDILSNAVGNSSGPVDYLKFEDVPTTVAVGTPVTVSVSAYDALDQQVTNYTGQVEFTVITNNLTYALVPPAYTFTAQDLGKHTFSLAFMFQQPGSYIVQVRDKANPSLTGEYVFEATGVGATTTANVMVSNPIAGTYSNNIQVISGKATAGSKVKIFDNEIAIGSATTDVNGNFTYTTGVLADGEHVFYVATVNEIGTIIEASTPVTVRIDTAAPESANVTLEPTGDVEPNTLIVVKLYSDDNLSKVSLSFEGNIYEMTKDVTAGYFRGAFSAPATPGQYKLSFEVTDQLGNKLILPDQATLTVVVAAPTPEVTSLGDVTGLKATPGDERVTLTWNAPTLAQYGINHYRVYYGEAPNALTNAVDTFTNSTTWYIPNLNNGQVMYFAVIAVDEKGNISEHFGDIVPATPNPVVVEMPDPCILNGTCGDIEDLESDVSETGPEVVWLLGLSLLAGFGYRKAARKKLQMRDRQ